MGNAWLHNVTVLCMPGTGLLLSPGILLTSLSSPPISIAYHSALITLCLCLGLKLISSANPSTTDIFPPIGLTSVPSSTIYFVLVIHSAMFSFLAHPVDY